MNSDTVGITTMLVLFGDAVERLAVFGVALLALAVVGGVSLVAYLLWSGGFQCFWQKSTGQCPHCSNVACHKSGVYNTMPRTAGSRASRSRMHPSDFWYAVLGLVLSSIEHWKLVTAVVLFVEYLAVLAVVGYHAPRWLLWTPLAVWPGSLVVTAFIVLACVLYLAIGERLANSGHSPSA